VEVEWYLSSFGFFTGVSICPDNGKIKQTNVKTTEKRQGGLCLRQMVINRHIEQNSATT
jgi:hypothetical protein